MSLEYWYLFPVSIGVATLAMVGVLGADLFPAIVLKTIFAVGHVYGFIEEGGGEALQETVNVA
ncbi:MAG: hypothetical protein JRD92_17210, partial [Deltaproteobacteria bacterium]|nr:hypothetical protein [Deltaproteobacteria bacterium]